MRNPFADLELPPEFLLPVPLDLIPFLDEWEAFVFSVVLDDFTLKNSTKDLKDSTKE